MFANRIKPGLKVTTGMIVDKKDTAAAYGSGLLEVLATPAMVSFMEKTSMELVQPFLDEGMGTVGTSINIKHLKATSTGEAITCTSILEEVEGNRLLFRVSVYDSNGLAGEGKHERFIINEKRFLSKLGKL